MRRNVGLLVVLGAALALAAHAQTKAPAVAFVDVNVVTMDSERVLPRQTVLTQGDRIVQVGPRARVKVPGDAVVVQGAGKYLMPGLAEMHGHVPPPTAPAEFLDAVLFLYVANGVTTVRGMLGAPGQLELREKANRGAILAPTLYLAGPSYSGNSINSPAEAEQKAREQKAAGWDLLKVHPGLTRDEYDAMARTARDLGIRFAGHVPAEAGLLHALEMGQETIDHLDGYIEYLEGAKGPVPQEKLAEVARQTKAAGAWVVPTMALWETLLGVADLETLRSYPELKYMPKQQVDTWVKGYQQRISSPKFNKAEGTHAAANRKRLLKALHDGGVGILFGTDAPQVFSVPGFSIHREMRLMAEAGMTPYEILRSGTRTIGEYFKSKDTFGAIAVNQRADLILLDADPLKDVAHVARRSGVMVRGRWLPEREIQERLEKLAGPRP